MGDYVEPPTSGKIPFAVGQASIVRIPVPGSNGLCIEFRPRGPVPKTGSTSTLFIQDPIGKRHLRLDYGINPTTKTIDYHWNQKGVYNVFGITNHTAVDNVATAYRAAKYFRYAGRVLFVAGIAIDALSIAQATKPLRRASEVVAGWAAAWIGCKAIGAVGAYAGSAVGPGLGTAIGGVTGCVVGGIGGYAGGSSIAGGVYDWGEEAYFMSLPVVDAP